MMSPRHLTLRTPMMIALTQTERAKTGGGQEMWHD
jgi:hypothetical protein